MWFLQCQEMSYNGAKCQFLQLPTEIISQILQYVHLRHLLLNVTRVCKYLYTFVHHDNCLWKYFDTAALTDDFVSFSKEQMMQILHHSSVYRSFVIPYTDIDVPVWELDYLLCKSLSLSCHLVTLNLMGCPISTLSFLQHLPHLQLLNVSDCPNLFDVDFGVIKLCSKLETLQIRRTNISSCLLTDILVPALSNLTNLDASSVNFTCMEIWKLMQQRYLASFCLSLQTHESLRNFVAVENHYTKCMFFVSNRHIFIGL